MDGNRADGLCRTIGTRRAALAGIAGLLAGGASLVGGRSAAAKKKCAAGQAKCGKGCCAAGQACLAGSCATVVPAGSTCAPAAGFRTSQLDGARSVAVDGSGLTAFVGSAYGNGVGVWSRSSPTGTDWKYRTAFGAGGPEQLQAALGVASSDDGLTVLVADEDRALVSVWTRPSASSNAWTHLGNFGAEAMTKPCGVACSPDGLTALVVDREQYRVTVWTRPGAASADWAMQSSFGAFGFGPGQFYEPRAVAVSPDGLTAWVTDIGSSIDKVEVWTRPSAGSVEWTVQGRFGAGDGAVRSSPLGVAASPDGLVAWVAEGLNYVSTWTRPSASSAAWTRSHRVLVDVPPFGIWDPSGVASRGGGTMWVVDTENNVVSVWSGCG